ncbi:MAG: hypothetical protein IH820_16500, partial [Bacteroidetes bacterium]|nr:hypothetical protein [Bacteroidota bacterium]
NGGSAAFKGRWPGGALLVAVTLRVAFGPDGETILAALREHRETLIALVAEYVVIADLVFMAILALALLFPASGHATPPWTLGVVGMVFVIGFVLARQSREQPLLDLSRLQPGRRWKQRWLPERNLQQGQHFVVFLSRSCSYCKRWVPLLNVMNTQGDLPDVVGIMGIEDEEMAVFRQEHLIRFPVLQMQPMLFRQMVDSYPTAVLIDESVVKERWVGEIPQPYFDRIKQFYDGIRPASSTSKTKTFGG